jgi:hypothetical protein
MSRARRDPDGTLHQTHEGGRVDVWPEVRLRFAEVDGRLVLATVEIGARFDDPDAPDPEPIRTSHLRKLPLARLVEAQLRTRESYADALETLRQDPKMTETYRRRAAKMRTQVAATRTQARKRGRRPLYSREHFERVAKIYGVAYETGAPTREVAEVMGVARSTANKWVARARQMGLLNPTEPRKAGGVKKGRKRR